MSVPYFNANPGSKTSKWTNNVIAVKNMSGSTEALGSMVRVLGMQNTETMKKVMLISNLMKLTVGSIQIIRGILSLLKHKEAIETLKASALTSEKALEGPSGWALIGSAVAATAVVSGALFAMQVYHKDSFDMDDKYQRDKNARELGGIINGS